MRRGNGQDDRRRDTILVGALWLVLTILGELLVWLWITSIMPERYAETSAIIDDAFIWLTALAVPVWAFVISFVTVAVLRHRRAPGEEVDGEPIKGSKGVYTLWFAITGGLALSIFIFPGLVGMAQLHHQAQPHHDGAEPLVIEMAAAKWQWTATYLEQEILIGGEGAELVLPVDQQVEFRIVSRDILHSFWIPAFRVKIDAVPGITTEMTLTPEKVGSTETDPLMRIQCAELCGLHHSTMAMPVRVVEADEFDAWLAATGAGGGGEPACVPDSTELVISAKDIQFDTACMAVQADTPFTIEFENLDDAIPHNVAIAEDQAWTQVLFTGETFPGVDTKSYEVPGLPAGNYFFRCDVHPAMFGEFIVVASE